MLEYCNSHFLLLYRLLCQHQLNKLKNIIIFLLIFFKPSYFQVLYHCDKDLIKPIKRLFGGINSQLKFSNNQ